MLAGTLGCRVARPMASSFTATMSVLKKYRIKIPVVPIAQDQEQGEVIRRQGDVAQGRIGDPPEQQVTHRHHQHHAAQIHRRGEELKEAVHFIQHQDDAHGGFGEKPEMAQDDHQKGVVEGDGPQPQPLIGPVNQPGAFGIVRVLHQLRPQVPEQAAEGQHFQGHAADQMRGSRRDCPASPPGPA